MTSWIHKPGVLAAVLAAGLSLLPNLAWAGNTVTFEAVMIHASNKPAPIDRRLEHIEYKLRKVFSFEHYRHAGEGSVTLSLPGSGTINLSGGYQLQIRASGTKDGKIRTEVDWTKGGSSLLSTSTKVGKGAPATVLGGASQGGGKLIVTLRVK